MDNPYFESLELINKPVLRGLLTHEKRGKS